MSNRILRKKTAKLNPWRLFSPFQTTGVLKFELYGVLLMWRVFHAMSSRHSGQYKENCYIMDEVLIANLPPTKAPGYTDAFSNRSTLVCLLNEMFAFSWSLLSFPCEHEVKTQRHRNVGLRLRLRLLFIQRFLTFRCVRCVKIKDTDDIWPVKDGPQFPWW